MMNTTSKALLQALQEPPGEAPRPLGLAELAQRLTTGWQPQLERIARRESAPFQGTSCRRGCAACCRHPVPLSVPEAFLLADLVNALPAVEGSAVRHRFAAAAARLEAAGLAGRPLLSLGHEYMALALPCPFLVEEACSIHPQRPGACREHLVVSAPEHCATLDGGAQTIALPLRLLDVLAAVAAELLGEAPVQIPLVRALDWCDANSGFGRRRWSADTLRRALTSVLQR